MIVKIFVLHFGDALQKAGDSASQQLQQLAAPANSARDKAQDAEKDRDGRETSIES